MKILTKKFEQTKPFGVGACVNGAISRIENLEKWKKLCGTRINPRKGSIENLLVEKQGCLLATVNEIYDWIATNDPTDSRNKMKRIPCVYDEMPIIWTIDFHDCWHLSTVYVFSNIEKNLKK